MDLEQCFKVHNLVVIQLNNTKLDQMTNLKVIFHMVVSINWIKFETRSILSQRVAPYQSFFFSNQSDTSAILTDIWHFSRYQ